MSKKINHQNETKIYGVNACLALYKKRPQDIIQLFLTKEKLNLFSPITKYCALHKKAYHLVTSEELKAITEAVHHEDVCMLIKNEKNETLEQYLKSKPKKSILLALENVSNPHNIGALLRSAAHFGVDGIILEDLKAASTAAAIRTSEGGAFYLKNFKTDNLKKTIEILKKNDYQIITTSSHFKKSISLYDLKWEKKVVIVLGEEANGLTKAILELGTAVKIPGTEQIESLNVSAATAIILSDYFQKTIKK